MTTRSLRTYIRRQFAKHFGIPVSYFTVAYDAENETWIVTDSSDTEWRMPIGDDDQCSFRAPDGRRVTFSLPAGAA